MDFLVDQDEIFNLIEYLNMAAEELYNTIDSIYDGIDAMSEGWQGESYVSFKTKAEEYRTSLDAMAEAYQVFRNLLLTKIVCKDVAEMRKTFAEAYSILGGE
jgi:uncharacterized protein YukE